MVCDGCGADKDNPHHITCYDCEQERKCEYCGDSFKNINIGKLLGGEDKWGCNSCYDKLVRDANVLLDEEEDSL